MQQCRSFSESCAFALFVLLLTSVPLQAAEPPFNPDQYTPTLKKYRAILKNDKKNETARRGLVEITIRLVLGAEQLYSVAQPEEARAVLTRLEKELPDTLWRLGHLAGQDNRQAQLAMGLLHKYGVLAKKDKAKACGYFDKTKGRNIPAADYHAALCLPEENKTLSLALMMGAAKGGHPEAQELLAYSCLHAAPRDLPCVIEWGGKAAAQGRPKAASLLGWLYSEGIGVERDTAKALGYYQDAAGAGDFAAMNNLGEFYETGAAGQKDIKQAAHWYQSAARKGFAPAQLNLGRLHAGGAPGFPADSKRARHWLKRAEAGGLAREARAILDWLDKQTEQGK